jgi:hypothetical protein
MRVDGATEFLDGQLGADSGGGLGNQTLARGLEGERARSGGPSAFAARGRLPLLPPHRIRCPTEALLEDNHLLA